MDIDDFIDVSSSNIDKVYLENNQLYIIFTSGQVYLYDNVPYGMYQSFLSSESKGKYFYKYIKNVFECKHVGTLESFEKMLDK